MPLLLLLPVDCLGDLSDVHLDFAPRDGQVALSLGLEHRDVLGLLARFARRQRRRGGRGVRTAAAIRIGTVRSGAAAGRVRHRARLEELFEAVEVDDLEELLVIELAEHGALDLLRLERHPVQVRQPVLGLYFPLDCHR